MYEIKRGKRFVSSVKRLIGSGRFDKSILERIFSFLIQGKELPAAFRDHALVGDMDGKRECHIEGGLSARL